jgi:hypothetical protein
MIAGTLASLMATANADNINTSGVLCQNFNASQALDIDYLSTGVRNLATSARSVICAIPRSPLAATPLTTFFVDGQNNPGTSTSCTVTVYSYFGTIRSTQSFTEIGEASGRTWDHFVTMSPQPSTFDYASVVCTLPASAGGRLFGVIAVQP